MEITDVKRGLLPKHVSQRTQQHGDYTNFVGNDKNNVFQLSHGIKSTRQSKLYQLYTHLRKTFFASATFKGL